MTGPRSVGMLAAHTAMARRPVAGSHPRRWPAVLPGSGAGGPPATSPRQQGGAPAWLPAWPVFLALGLTLALSAPFVVFALVTLAGYVHGQLLGAVLHADFLNYYSAARMLLEQPRNLYSPGAEAAFQRELASGSNVYDQFWSPPQVALLYVPLALLPYGLAYLAWFLINLGLLALSAHWLAPRVAGRAVWWLWTLLALSFLPVQEALVDGQTPFVLLCGLSAFVRLRTGGPRTAPIALLTWAWKVQLLPAVLLALVLDRRWRAALGLLVAQAVAAALVVWWAGTDVLQRYVELARTSSMQTALRLSPPGQTLLGLAQSVVGVGSFAFVAALIGSAIVAGAFAATWSHGLLADPRRYLQLALLPLVAVLIAARAGTYELTLWLASAWLLLRYAREVPRHRILALAIVFVGWWGGQVASIAERTSGFEWGAVTGLAAFGSLVWMMRTAPERPAAA